MILFTNSFDPNPNKLIKESFENKKIGFHLVENQNNIVINIDFITVW